MSKILFEVCVGNIDDVELVDKYPVDRIELTSAMELGGLTPTIGMLKSLRALTAIPTVCMVRPHAHGFCYGKHDIAIMFEDAKALLEAGADGIVFGFLDQHNEIDLSLTQQMTQLVHLYGKEAIFHKAFDQTKNIERSLVKLIEVKVDRVLSEGGNHQGDIQKGFNTLHALNQKYQKDIEILAGGGIRAENVVEVIEKTGCRQVHSSCKTSFVKDGLQLVKVDEQKLSAMSKQLARFRQP